MFYLTFPECVPHSIPMSCSTSYAHIVFHLPSPHCVPVKSVTVFASSSLTSIFQAHFFQDPAGIVYLFIVFTEVVVYMLEVSKMLSTLVLSWHNCDVMTLLLLSVYSDELPKICYA